MSTYEEEIDRLERKINLLTDELGTFLTTVLLAPPERTDIIQEAASMALESLKAET